MAPAQKKNISFIEDKPIDYDRLRQLLEVSAQANHWANFGPVEELLIQYITTQLNLPSHGEVILTCSCTSALEAMAQALYLTLNRQPRFVTSSFAFFSTNRGAYSQTQLVDCNKEGFLSLEELERIPPKSYDAIVLTNIFGLLNDISSYWEFAKTHDKYLLLDNAAGYTAFPNREVHAKILEAISFHHTKPHGFGEGGCIIAHKSWLPSLKAIINFGAELPSNPVKVGLNAKLSDPAAALILQRLEQRSHWAAKYIDQARRIKRLAEGAGLKPLVPNADLGLTIPGQLPYLSDQPIEKASLVNEFVTLRKYYIPFDAEKEKSRSIYAQIVNIPCHPDMATISDAILFDLFKSFVK